jgi:UDP-N-acetylglucosamine 1-carboxyvinyltransferase
MDKIRVVGGRRLSGSVPISGAKNAALPAMAASLLTDQPVLLENVPEVWDTSTMRRLLTELGARVDQKASPQIEISVPSVRSYEAPYELVKTMRASVLVLGPLEHGFVDVTTDGLRGTEIYFDNVTVTGTENVLMAACLARGETLLANCAQEPEVVDLAELLVRMGAHIEGAGTRTIRVSGVERLGGASHRVIPDRIEAGTFLAAGAMVGDGIEVAGCRPDHLRSVVDKLADVGVELTVADDSIRVNAPKELQATNVRTLPYPGFPTDMQAQLMILLTQASGTSVIAETIFEHRFMHVAELNRMGANIKLDGHTAVVKGPTMLSGARVMATDLRASACLILAGLGAEGPTVVDRGYDLDRGYQHIEEKLAQLGADIERVKR